MTDLGRCDRCGEYRYWCRNLGCVDGFAEPEYIHDCGGHPKCDQCRAPTWFTFETVELHRVHREKVEPNEDGSFTVSPGYTYTWHASSGGESSMWMEISEGETPGP